MVKRFATLLSILFLTVNSFSQTIIPNRVILTENQAKGVITDLIEGQKAQEQVDSLLNVVSIQNDIIITCDSLLIAIDKKLILSQELLNNAQNQIEVDRELQEKLQSSVRVNRAYAIGFGCTTVVGAAFIVKLILDSYKK